MPFPAWKRKCTTERLPHFAVGLASSNTSAYTVWTCGMIQSDYVAPNWSRFPVAAPITAAPIPPLSMLSILMSRKTQIVQALMPMQTYCGLMDRKHTPSRNGSATISALGGTGSAHSPNSCRTNQGRSARQSSTLSSPRNNRRLSTVHVRKRSVFCPYVTVYFWGVAMGVARDLEL